MSEAIEVKLVIVGNTSVGKTCVVKRATTDTYSDDSVATLGASYVSKTAVVNDTEVRLQIWDTAGQERYRGMTPMYYRGAQLAVLVYAIDDRSSFDGIEDWITSLNDNADKDILKILVGNKMDIEEGRVISAEDGKAAADKFGCNSFFEVSAKTGREIKELFDYIPRLYLEKRGGVEEKVNKDVVALKPSGSGKKKAGKCC